VPEAPDLDVDTTRRLVREGYDAIADDYLRLVETDAPEQARRRWVAEVLRRLPARSSVLDLGCGPAVPVGLDVVAADHRYTGIDVSARQIEHARAHVPTGTFLVGDASDASFAAGDFDAVLMLYAIAHVPREQWADLLARCHAWLAPEGVLLFNSPEAGSPGWLEEDFLGTSATSWTNSHDATVTRHIVEGAGFEIVASETLPDDVPDAGPGWTWFLAVRRR
jgi:SAM-dependent methyltransferase